MSLEISKDLSLPDDAVTQTFAILAQRRKGKTYTANVMAEEMVKAGIPWVALDPTGAWWGLRSSADGKKAGLPVYVFGGDHGDLPLERTAGKMIADLVVEHPGWYVLDFSHFESKEAERQLATDFAERFYRRKGTNKTPMHLFVDEADMFAPQRTPAGDQRMLGAFESIVRRGGIRGIGTTLITQRAAVLNKNVLEQIDVLIALRTVGPNDRKAIAGYVDAYATPEQQSELLGSIASLELGEAWVWEPGADLFKRIHIRKRRTFNSSATPKAGDTPHEVVTLAKIDLDKIRDQMAATIEQAKSDDPTELKRQIGVLKLELADQKPQVELQQVEVLPANFRSRLDDMIAEAQGVFDELVGFRDYCKNFSDASDTDSQFNSRAVIPEQFTHNLIPKKGETVGFKGFGAADGNYHVRDAKKMGEHGDSVALTLEPQNTDLRKGELRMLAVIGRSWPLRLTKAQMAVMAKMKITGGTFGTYYGRLKREGYLTEMPDTTLEPSDKALAAVGVARTQAPQSPSERLAMWREVLPAGAQKLLDIVVTEVHTTKDELAEISGFAASGGTFGTYIGMLRRNGIIETEGNTVTLARELH